MTRRVDPLPRFARPPLEEVSLAVAFQAFPMRVVDIGLLWQEAYSELFSHVEEQGRVEMTMERFDGQSGPSTSFQVLSSPPQPRVWFANDAQTQLVQIQNDWFARNWRRMTNDAYPHYPRLRTPFQTDLQKLIAYAASHGWGAFKPTQVEFTYFNHIPLGDDGPADLTDILTTVARSHHFEQNRGPELSSYRAQFVLESKGLQFGRLHVVADPATRRSDGRPIQVVTLTARGRPMGEGVDGVLAFLDVGHVALVNEFDRITTTKMHQLWGKTDAR